MAIEVTSVYYSRVDSFPMWKKQQIFRNLAIITAVALVAIVATTAVFAALVGAAVIPYSLPIILGVGGALVGITAITFVALTVFTAAFYTQKSKKAHVDAANKQMEEGAANLRKIIDTELYQTSMARQDLDRQKRYVENTYKENRLELNKRFADMIARDADTIKRKDEVDKKSGELDARRLQVINRENGVSEEEIKIALERESLKKEKAELEETRNWVEGMHREIVFGVEVPASSSSVLHSKLYDFDLTVEENCRLGNPLPAVNIKGREGVQWSFYFSEYSDWSYLVGSTKYRPLKEKGCIEIDWTNEERATPRAVEFLKVMKKGGYDELAALLSDGTSVIELENAVHLINLYQMQVSDAASRLIIRRLSEMNVRAFTEEQAIAALEIYCLFFKKEDLIGNFFSKFQHFHNEWLSDRETPANIRSILETGAIEVDWDQERATPQVIQIFRALRMNSLSIFNSPNYLRDNLKHLENAAEIFYRYQISSHNDNATLGYLLGRQGTRLDLTAAEAISLMQTASYLLKPIQVSLLFDQLRRFHLAWRDASWKLPPFMVEMLAKQS